MANEFIIKNGFISKGNSSIEGTFSLNTISATTYQNLPTDVRVTGGTYSSGTATFTNNTGGTFSVTGFSASSSLTVGTTPITSGTVGRILFQGAGDVVQQDAGFIFDSTAKTLTNYGKGALSSNTSFGALALSENTTGTNNTALGNGALQFAGSGTNNTALGFYALNNAAQGTFTGTGNIGIGYYAGGYIISGQNNVAIGNNSGGNLTTGSRNTIIGAAGLASNSTNNNVVISDGAGNNAIWKDDNNLIGIGHNPTSGTLGAKLDVRAQGVLSTDIAFRVRNSADTITNLSVDGLGQINTVLNSSNWTRTLVIGGSNTNNKAIGSGYEDGVILGYSNTFGSIDTLIIGNNNSDATSAGLGQNVIVGFGNTKQGVTIGNFNTGRGYVFGDNNTLSAANGNAQYSFIIGNNISVANSSVNNNTIFFGSRTTSGNAYASMHENNLGIGGVIPSLTNYDLNARGVFYTQNGTAPTTLANDTFGLYSADRGGVAGKASPHFRTEDGTINVLGDLSGIGTSTPQARLDVRAQGVLSTDIAFRVRNSADTDNLFYTQGNGTSGLPRGDSFLFQYGDASFGASILKSSQYGTEIRINQFSDIPTVISDLGFRTTGTISVGQTTQNSTHKISSTNGNGTEIDHILLTQGQNATKKASILFRTNYNAGISYDTARLQVETYVANSLDRTKFNFWASNGGFTVAPTIVGSLTCKSNILLGTPTEDINDSNTIYVPTGTAPTASITDGFKQYSADITSGNAAPHFRTENGDIIKLYKETTGVTASTLVSNGGTTITNTDTFDGYTIQQVVKALRNLGVLE